MLQPATDLATKDDVALQGSHLRSEMADLRTEMADVRTELKTDIQSLESSIERRMSEGFQ